MLSSHDGRTAVRSNIEVVESIADAARRLDWQRLEELMHADARVESPVFFPHGELHEGAPGYRSLRERVSASWAESKYGPRRFMGAGERVFVWFDWYARSLKTGRDIAMPVGELWTFREGKVSGLQMFFHDTRLLADIDRSGSQRETGAFATSEQRVIGESESSVEVCDSNLAITRNMYIAAEHGDWEAMSASFAPEFQVFEPLSLPYGGKHVGVTAFKALAATVTNYWVGFDFKLLELMPGGDAVIVLFQLSGKSPKTGKAFSFPIAEVWRFRDEQVVEMTIHYYDTDLLMNVDSSA